MARAISSRRSRGTLHARRDHRLTWRVAMLAAAACVPPRASPGDPQTEIGAMLQRAAADWNRGDLSGFMSDYAPESLTSYISRGHVLYGWQQLYDRYRAAYFAPGTRRDALTFEEVHVRPLAADLALCTARFRLLRGDSVTASGPFTLVLQKRGGRWYILHDHTSADPK